MAEELEAVLIENPEIGAILEWLPAVLAPKNPLTRAEYKACVEHASALQVHGEGVLPLHLIKEGRPKEPAEITAYRMAIYQPFTLTEWKKARAVLMRIFQPGGFQIRFSKELPAGVSEDDSLQAYTEYNFASYYSLLYKHLNPTLVRASMPCPTCRGVGRMSVAGEAVNCTSCSGTGYMGVNTEKTGSPYQDITYDIEQISKLGMKASDLMTYVAPPVANFQEVDSLIKSHIARGFGALNMEVVNQVGASQSGIAKAIDRQDLNGFLSECSEHFFAQLEWLYRTICELRYRPLLGEAWKELLPTIIRPTKFDYVTTDSMLSEMERAKNAETHPAIIKSLNVQAAHRFLGEKSIEAQMVQAQITLDPYDGMTEDAILSLNASGVLRRDYLYIHANVAELVKRGMEQNPNFLDLTQKEQMDILMGFAVLDLAQIDSTRLITPQGGEGGI